MVKSLATIDTRLRESIASYDASPLLYAKRFSELDPMALVGRLSKIVDLASGPMALDAGCGSGRDAAALSIQGARVVGVDLSREMVALSHGTVPQAEFVQADLRNLPFRASSFEIVWSMASLVHLDSPGTRRALREFNRVLTAGGVLFLSVPWGIGAEWRSDSRGGRRWFRYFQSADEVSSLLQVAGFVPHDIGDTEGVVSGRWISGFGLKP